MIKSCVSFFRKALKVKGRTWHTGRGAYVMEYDCLSPQQHRKVNGK